MEDLVNFLPKHENTAVGHLMGNENFLANYIHEIYKENSRHSYNTKKKMRSRKKVETSSATAEIDDGPPWNHETSFFNFSKNF